MWCHQWSSNGQYISMGISKGAMVLDTITTKMIACFTEKSDVFAQAFTEDVRVNRSSIEFKSTNFNYLEQDIVEWIT